MAADVNTNPRMRSCASSVVLDCEKVSGQKTENETLLLVGSQKDVALSVMWVSGADKADYDQMFGSVKGLELVQMGSGSR